MAVKAVAGLELLFKVSGGKNPMQYLNIMEMSQIIKMEYRIEFKKMNCLETNKKNNKNNRMTGILHVNLIF